MMEHNNKTGLPSPRYKGIKECIKLSNNTEE